MGKEDPKARVQHMHHNTNLKYDKHYILILLNASEGNMHPARSETDLMAWLEQRFCKYILPESSVDKCFITLINYCLRHMIV